VYVASAHELAAAIVDDAELTNSPLAWPKYQHDIHNLRQSLVACFNGPLKRLKLLTGLKHTPQ
jgi:hypothetical protein